DGGEAIYPFTLSIPGKYVVTAMINAPNSSANSFYVNVDSEPTDPYMTWDTQVSNGFTNEIVCWRGAGTTSAPQFSPQIFTLMAGSHRLIIRGREGNTQLQSVTIAPLGPQLQLAILPGKTFLLSGLGTPGYTYAVQMSSDLKTWSTLNSAVADS